MNSATTERHVMASKFLLIEIVAGTKTLYDGTEMVNPSWTFEDTFNSLVTNESLRDVGALIQVRYSANSVGAAALWHKIKKQYPVVQVVDQLNIKRIKFETEVTTLAVVPTLVAAPAVAIRSMSDVLMQATSMRRLPDEKAPAVRNGVKDGKDLLFNRVREYCVDNDMNFRTDSTESMNDFFSSMVQLFWTLSPYLPELTNLHVLSRENTVPLRLRCLFGYRVFKNGSEEAGDLETNYPTATDNTVVSKKSASHRTKPALSQEILAQAQKDIIILHGRSYLALIRFQVIRDDLEGLKKCVSSLLDKRVKDAAKHHQLRGRTTNAREFENSVSVQSVDALLKSSDLDSRFELINDILITSEVYIPIDVENFLPSKKSGDFAVSQARKRFWNDLQLRCNVECYTWNTGNHGNVRFIWRLPDDLKKLDLSKTALNVLNLSDKIPKFLSRKALQLARDLFQELGLHSNNGLDGTKRDLLIQAMTGNATAQLNISHKERFERLNWWLESKDPELVLDLRICNGNPADPCFDVFWEEMGKWVTANCSDTVDERRHGDPYVSRLPAGMSVPDVVNQVTLQLFERYEVTALHVLPAEVKVPSIRWVGLQMLPRHPRSHSAKYHTGRFNLQPKLQVFILLTFS